MPRKRNNAGKFDKSEQQYVKRCYMMDKEDDVAIRNLIMPGESISDVIRKAVKFYLESTPAQDKPQSTTMITVVGYAAMVGEYPTETVIRKKEARCKNRCRILGLTYTKTFDHILGEVGEFPLEVVKEIW